MAQILKGVKVGEKSKGILVGTLVGGVVAAVTTLLVTPKSGKELRSDIQGQAVSVKNNVVHIASNAKKNVVESKVVDKVRTLKFVGKKKYQSIHEQTGEENTVESAEGSDEKEEQTAM
ncbi:YtxH domain-containing protein [Priestia koreensis]|uniref:YtxH domain-containing protein n=1 Tax=Priestia koreensis TaxID=284581 RepID=UPI0006A9DCF3|nr:YtxH domain-containing protein [Priestia koreensis]